MLYRFQTTSQSIDEDVDRKVVVEQVIEFEPGLDTFSEKLIEVKSAQARVFLMYARYVKDSKSNNYSHITETTIYYKFY